MDHPATDNGVREAARADVWLWRARFFKSRSAAGKFVREEKLRVERDGEVRRLRRASAQLRPGDVLTFARSGRTVCVRVLEPGLRRGPASEAAGLYETVLPGENAPRA
jgi:ribosome-associated heat shock protein Hsp15